MNPSRQQQPFSMLAAVFVGVIIWASLIAWGVFRQSGGSWGKTLIVVGVVVVFLGGWSWLLKRK